MAYLAAGSKTVRNGRAALSIAWLVLVLAAGAAPARAQSEPPARGDLSVNDAVRIALDHNPDLGTARENVRSAAGARNVARQTYLPRLSAAYTRFHSYNGEVVNLNTLTAGGSTTYGSNYNLTQNIFDVPSLLGIRAAGKDLGASREDYRFARSDLVLTVKQQYYALLAAQELAAVNDSALAVALRELDRTRSLFELGMVARSDVLKQEVQVAQSRLDAINGHADVVNQRARLSQDLGQDPTDDLHASDRLSETPVAVDSVAIVADALNNRPDLRASRLSWEAAKARARGAKAGFLPTLGLSLQYSNSNANGVVPFTGFAPRFVEVGQDTFVNVHNGRRQMALTLSVPFLDGVVGRTGTIQEAAARSTQAQYAFEKQRLQVETDTRSAINAARQANEGIEVAKSGLASAQEDLKLSQEKYNVGSGTILDLLNAQVNLQKAQQQYVLALTQARVAEAQIERARGIVP